MKEASLNNFGLLIAYLVPGFVALWGASYFSETLQAWLVGTTAEVPTVGGFLYVTLGSVAAGLTISAIRWATVDVIHHRTGIRPPEWDFLKLHQSLNSFDVLVESHYRYYQHYANMRVALLFAYPAWRIVNVGGRTLFVWSDLAFLLLEIILFIASRDTLRNYYVRTAQLLTHPPHPAAERDRSGVDGG